LLFMHAPFRHYAYVCMLGSMNDFNHSQVRKLQNKLFRTIQFD
jgi:hypothetical protein